MNAYRSARRFLSTVLAWVFTIFALLIFVSELIFGADLVDGGLSLEKAAVVLGAVTISLIFAFSYGAYPSLLAKLLGRKNEE